jgi:hypothetical protein
MDLENGIIMGGDGITPILSNVRGNVKRVSVPLINWILLLYSIDMNGVIPQRSLRTGRAGSAI